MKILISILLVLLIIIFSLMAILSGLIAYSILLDIRIERLKAQEKLSKKDWKDFT